MLKNLSLSNDMFSSRKYVFFFDEEIGTIEDKTNLTFAYPYKCNTGAPFTSHEAALLFLLDVRNKSAAKQQTISLTKTQLTLL